MKKPTLTEQLLLICILIVVIVIISLVVILPRTLLPVYEENLYNYLNESLNIIDKLSERKINSEIAYIYIDSDNNTFISNNTFDVIKFDDVNDVIKLISDSNGKISYKNKSYYYTLTSSNGSTKIAITGDAYINLMKAQILRIILLVVGITFIIISLVILMWSNHLVNRIKKLKDKIDNINNDDYSHKMIYDYDDELYTLEVAIENMRVYLKEQ